MELKIKLYIFRKNSPWGVIKDPVKGNIYTHVVNFPDDEIFTDFPVGKLKHNFINKYLMEENLQELEDLRTTIAGMAPGAERSKLQNKLDQLTDNPNNLDWLRELEKQPYKPFTPQHFIDETKFIYRIKLNEFNPHKLLNADYAVIMFGYGVDIRYEFYTLKILPNNNNLYINFEFELDLFFTYPEATKFKPNTQNYMLSGHIDRFERWGLKIVPKKSILSQIEDTNIIPTQRKSKKIHQYYGNYHGKTEIEKRIIESIRFMVVYIPNNIRINDKNINIEGPDWTYNCKLPYAVLIVPFINVSGWSIYINTIKSTPSIPINNYKFYIKKVYDTLSKNLPMGSIYSVKIEQFLPNSFWTSFNINYSEKSIIFTINTNLLNFERIEVSSINKTKQYLNVLKLNKLTNPNSSHIDDNMVWFSKQKIKTLIDLPDFNKIFEKFLEIDDTDVLNTILNKKKDIKLETKLYSPQFLKFYIHTWETQQQVFNLIKLWDQYINEGVINNDILNKIKIEISFLPEKSSSLVYLGYESQAVISEKDNTGKTHFFPGGVINRSFVEIENNKEMPTSTTDYSTYVRNNRNKLTIAGTIDTIKQIAGVGLGVTGAVALSGGAVPFISTGAAAGALIAAGTGMTIAATSSKFNREAMLDDLKNIPASLNNGTNNTIRNLMNGPLEKGLFWTKEELLKKQKKVLFDKFFKNGYKVEELKNLNKIVNSRYYFNKIHCTDVFNTLNTTKINLSTRKKQIISDTYASGSLVIWHVRNLNRFDFMNFERENWEMSLIKKNLDVVLFKDMDDIFGVENPLITEGEYTNIVSTQIIQQTEAENAITNEQQQNIRDEEKKQEIIRKHNRSWRIVLNYLKNNEYFYDLEINRPVNMSFINVENWTTHYIFGDGSWIYSENTLNEINKSYNITYNINEIRTELLYWYRTTDTGLFYPNRTGSDGQLLKDFCYYAGYKIKAEVEEIKLFTKIKLNSSDYVSYIYNLTGSDNNINWKDAQSEYAFLKVYTKLKERIKLNNLYTISYPDTSSTNRQYFDIEIKNNILWLYNLKFPIADPQIKDKLKIKLKIKMVKI